MIAMQYGFTLPANYDMDIIRQRISLRGSALDGFPGLQFKSYLFTDRHNLVRGSMFNRYAPFYLWDDPQGMTAFLTGSGFAGLVADFGRPQVRMWSVLDTRLTDSIRHARWATIKLKPLGTDLTRPPPEENDLQHSGGGRPLACVSALDPREWNTLEFKLWDTAPTLDDKDTQCWEVGYVAGADHVRWT